MNWWKSLKGKVKLKEPLRKHTTFKIGGAVEYFIEPNDADDLKLLLNLAKRYKIKLFIIGLGSNVLANDKKINAAVLRLSSPYFRRLSVDGNYLEAGGGCLSNQAVLVAKNNGLSGLEWMAGIPGTIGGALIMNAGGGREGDSIGDLTEEVTVMDYNGDIKILKRKEIKFDYRESNLSEYIILAARLKLRKTDKNRIEDRMDYYISRRKATQDLTMPSAGCIFKNPHLYSAGRLIDLCFLKGKRIGDACVSAKHANFIVNTGQAKADDVIKLISLIKRKVKSRFNLKLDTEIKIWH